MLEGQSWVWQYPKSWRRIVRRARHAMATTRKTTTEKPRSHGLTGMPGSPFDDQYTEPMSHGNPMPRKT